MLKVSVETRSQDAASLSLVLPAGVTPADLVAELVCGLPESDGQEYLVIRRYWPPSSPIGIRGFLDCSRGSMPPSGGDCMTEIRCSAGRMVD